MQTPLMTAVGEVDVILLYRDCSCTLPMRYLDPGMRGTRDAVRSMVFFLLYFGPDACWFRSV